MHRVLFQRADERFAPCLQPDAIVDPGVIHQPVDAAEGRQRLADRAAAGRLVAQFGEDHLGARLQPLQIGQQRRFRRGVSDQHRDRAFCAST